MSFKLSLKNIQKSFKDYTIYFLTLVFGVAIFYIFNSIDSQQAMLAISDSKIQILEVMNNILGYISIFISFVLGFLIVYANNFLIKRRKKEFAIYMTLGMGKGKISKILWLETILVGIISLIVGLGIGVIGSQMMSVLVAKMFEVDMTSYQFVFSMGALFKTICYFGIIYVCVMLFNTIVISKCKLIDLLNAAKKNEKIKVKNPVLSIFLFIVSIGCLGIAYYLVLSDKVLMEISLLGYAVILGVIGTFLFFTSLSGFIIRLVQSSKRIYLKNLNVFVLRQLDSKISTTVVSMSMICLMLFFTICILSSAWSLNDIMKRDLQEVTPVDITFERIFVSNNTDDTKTIAQFLEEKGYTLDEYFDEYVEVTEYTSDKKFTLGDTLGETLEEILERFPYLRVGSPETMMKVSDYNKVAKLFGNKTITLKENEYAIVCDYDQALEYRNQALQNGTKITLNEKEYIPSVKECIYGFTKISPNHMNIGIIVFPDSALEHETQSEKIMNANLIKNTENEQLDFIYSIDEAFHQKDEGAIMRYNSKLEIYESSTGFGAIVIFIGLYLGIIFLITSAAILALKELSESSDNQSRYGILRKIGTDEKMIQKSLLIQIGIFFLVPLLVASIHSAVGFYFIDKILASFGKSNLLPSIGMTALVILAIYGGYFIATYFGSKAIIKEKNR